MWELGLLGGWFKNKNNTKQEAIWKKKWESVEILISISLHMPCLDPV